MVYTTDYQSPLGTIFLAADEKGLTGLWLEGQKYYAAQIKKEECRQEKTPVLKDAERWLDIYFQGKEPDFMPALHPVGTEFQSAVWEILRRIPYGRTITYGEIAGQLAAQRGVKKMSAQAVGGAVGHNKISIIIPCHRVVGSNGSLTGYAGGIDKPVPIRLANATTNAWKEEMCFISPSTFTSIDSSSCPISSGCTLSG